MAIVFRALGLAGILFVAGMAPAHAAGSPGLWLLSDVGMGRSSEERATGIVFEAQALDEAGPRTLFKKL